MKQRTIGAPMAKINSHDNYRNLNGKFLPVIKRTDMVTCKVYVDGEFRPCTFLDEEVELFEGIDLRWMIYERKDIIHHLN